MKRLLLLTCLAALLLSACGPAKPPVLINEIMASNGETIADEDGDYEDWIEFYNAGSEAINLAGYYLSDDDEDPLLWQFPDVVIPPQGFLLVWASGKDRTDGELHTNFKINREGEPLTLTLPDARTVVDRVEATIIPRDYSFGRLPDGGGAWNYLLLPNPGSSNVDSIGHTLEPGYFDEPKPRAIPFEWVALGVLAVVFVPLFIVFWKKTKR